jgi:hypothetical protein
MKSKFALKLQFAIVFSAKMQENGGWKITAT